MFLLPRGHLGGLPILHTHMFNFYLLEATGHPPGSSFVGTTHPDRAAGGRRSGRILRTQTRPWALIWRGQTLGLWSQIPRVLRYQELFEVSGTSLSRSCSSRTFWEGGTRVGARVQIPSEEVLGALGFETMEVTKSMPDVLSICPSL